MRFPWWAFAGVAVLIFTALWNLVPLIIDRESDPEDVTRIQWVAGLALTAPWAALAFFAALTSWLRRHLAARELRESLHGAAPTHNASVARKFAGLDGMGHIFGGVITLFISAFIAHDYLGVRDGLRNARRAQESWIKVPADVVALREKKRGKLAIYEYTFHGARHRGRRESFFSELYRDYPPLVAIGETITVFVDPSNPRESARDISLAMSKERCERHLVFDQIMLAIGGTVVAFFAFGAYRTLRRVPAFSR